jgi:hypothetical protein
MRVATDPVHHGHIFHQFPRPREHRICCSHDEQGFGLHTRGLRFRGRRPIPGLCAFSGASQHRACARRRKTFRLLNHGAVGCVLRIDGFHSGAYGVLHPEISFGCRGIRLLPRHDVLPVPLVPGRPIARAWRRQSLSVSQRRLFSAARSPRCFSTWMASRDSTVGSGCS